MLPTAPAPDDPAWKKTQEFIETMPAIRLLFFSGRLVDTFLFARDMLDLYEIGRDRIVHRMMHGVPQLLDEANIFIVKSPEERAEAIRLAISEMENNARAKVQQYERWIINQGLVTFCTIMDAFLENLLDTVLKKRVEILYGAAGAKNIELKEIVRLGTVDAVIEEFRGKEVKKFAFEDIEKRFDYIESKLGLSVEETFDWSRAFTVDVVKRLAGWDLGSLVDVYKKRHDIVHRDGLPVGSFDEMEQIYEFFSKIIWHLGALASRKHGVALDISKLLWQGELYRKLKSEESAKPPRDSGEDKRGEGEL